ncbi:MAG: YIP1 family protein [Candidatus Krumholzibacteriia bacterium]
MTDERIEVGSSAPAVPPERDSLLLRFWSLIVAPTRACVAIAQRPAWGVAAVALLVVSALYTGSVLHIIGPEQIEQQIESAGSDEAAMAMAGQLDRMRDPGPGMRIVIGLAAGVGALLFAVVLPGLVFQLFFRLSEGRGRMAQTFGVVAWTALVASTISYGLRALLILGRGSGEGVATGLALLVPDAPSDSPLFLALNMFGDVFIWWQVALMVIGFAVVHALPLVRSAVVTIAVSVLGGLMILGVQVISARLGG